MRFLSCLFIAGILVTNVFAKTPEPEFTTTPDTDRVSIQVPATFPDQQTMQSARDDQLFQNAVIAYRFWYPTVSAEAIMQGGRNIGIEDNKNIMMLATVPHHVGFTYNSDTPYGGGGLDLATGPMVIELPSGQFMGFIDDHHQRWIMDMGLVGPDQGKGGKYLLLPPDYKGVVPAGYYVSASSTYKVIVGFRVLPVNGDIDAAMKSLRDIKIYPLSTAATPAPITFIEANNIKIDTTPLRWETNLQFWQVLAQVINTEPMVGDFAPMYGLLKTLGIEKGKAFLPDARMKNILEQAAKAGHTQMAVSAFANDRADRMVWKDRKWEWAGFIDSNPNFATSNGIDLDARDRWFYQAIATSPAMFRRAPGKGSLYWLGLRDTNGEYLDGGKTYKLTVPLPVPSKLFWSLTVYDAGTRSQIQTDQEKAALRSLFELKDLGQAKSVDLYFGPNAPQGKEGFWIKTISGRHWFSYFRIYGPEEPTFSGAWKPGDFEELA